MLLTIAGNRHVLEDGEEIHGAPGEEVLRRLMSPLPHGWPNTVLPCPARCLLACSGLSHTHILSIYSGIDAILQAIDSNTL
jgi:hypothetical protein